MKNYIVPVIILGLLGVLLYTNMFQGEASALKHTKSGDFLLASGIVENNAVVVASEVPGTIKEFYIKEGDTVTKGQALQNDDNLENNTLSLANVKIAETNEIAISSYRKSKNTKCKSNKSSSKF